MVEESTPGVAGLSESVVAAGVDVTDMKVARTRSMPPRSA